MEKDQSYNLKIPVLVPTYNRYNYLVRFFSTLRKTENIENIEFIFFDDASRDGRVMEAIKGFKANKIIIKNRRHSKVFRRHLLKGMHYCFKNYNAPFIIKLDPDTIHHPSWFSKSLEIYNSYKDRFNIAAITPYLRSKKNIIKQMDNINIVSYVPGCVLLIMRDFWNVAKIDNVGRSWDWDIVHKAKEFGYVLISTQESYVQHIGERGIHSAGRSVNHSIDYIGENV